PPASITVFAASPAGVPAATAARRRSPVESCTRPNLSSSMRACVPLPAPGGPSRIRTAGTFAPLIRSGPVHAVADEVVDHRRVGQRRGVPQRAEVVLGDLAQNAAHDLARAGL